MVSGSLFVEIFTFDSTHSAEVADEFDGFGGIVDKVDSKSDVFSSTLLFERAPLEHETSFMLSAVSADVVAVTKI